MDPDLFKHVDIGLDENGVLIYSKDGGRTARRVVPEGGSQTWEEHDLSALVGDWTDDGIGTWTFVGGVISQTDDTADSFLQYNTGLPSIEYVVEAEIRIPSGQDAGTTGLAVIAAGNQDQVAQGATGTGSAVGEGAALEADAAGDGANYGLATWVDGNAQGNDGGWPTAITQDTWHTIRAALNGTRQLVYLDGAFLICGENVTGGNAFDSTVPTMPNLPMIGAIGLVDFRNVKVWTRALPA